MASPDLHQDLTCSSCLEVLSDLVVWKCGHNFCQGCMDRLLGIHEHGGGDTCPVCTSVSSPKPDKEKRPEPDGRFEVAPGTEEKPEKTEVLCTYCTGSQVPAVRSCLHCEASFCSVHLKVHTKSPEHILTKPTDSFTNNKCSIHNEVLDIYCCQHNVSICVLCHLKDHRGHQVCDFNTAFQKTKGNLEHAMEILKSEMQEIKKRVGHLRGRKVVLEKEMAEVMERVGAVLGNVRRQQDHLEKRVLGEISSQGEHISTLVSMRIHHLEEKQEEMSRKIDQLTELYETPDPHLFSQWLKSDHKDLHNLRRVSISYRKEDVKRALALKDFDEGPVFETLHTGLLDIVTAIKKGIYVQEVLDLWLDVNTAANNVAIAEDLKELSCPGSDQFRMEKQERFDFSQVLSIRTFCSGRHYWDVHVGECGDFRLGVAYSTIQRKGRQARIGNNDQSWCLGKEGDVFFIIHNMCKRPLEPTAGCRRIRTYLDYEAGQISFYELRDPIRHLHTFSATLAEPLHAAFCVFLTVDVHHTWANGRGSESIGQAPTRFAQFLGSFREGWVFTMCVGQEQYDQVPTNGGTYNDILSKEGDEASQAQ